MHILAHRIWISVILSQDRKPYLTHAILPRLSREGCTLVVLELKPHSHQVISLLCLSDVIISCHNLVYSGTSVSLFKQLGYLMVSKTKNPLVV